MPSSIAYRRIHCFANHVTRQDDSRTAEASDKRGPGNPVQSRNDVSLGSGARGLTDRSGRTGRQGARYELAGRTRSTDTTITACMKAGGNCGSCVPELKKLLVDMELARLSTG